MSQPDDIRAAAERLRRHSKPSYNPDEGWHPDDRKLVADAYLAANPADDDEPVTEEWLGLLPGLVVDPGSRDSTLIQTSGDTYLVIESDRSMAIQQGMYDDRDSQYIPVRAFECATRGAVRRLCACLGVPLTEPE